MVKRTAEVMEAKLRIISEDSWQQDAVKVAQLLDPSIKTSLLPDAASKLHATDLLKKFCGYYKNGVDAVVTTTTTTASSTTSIRAGFLKLLNRNTTGEQSEADRYLGTGIEPDCKPLEWWAKRREVFPTLAKLVRDLLAVCASSCESERWFSQSGRLVTKSRCSLGANSIQMAMCLKSWYAHEFTMDLSKTFDLTRT